MPPAHRLVLFVSGAALTAVTFMMGASFTSSAESAVRAEGAWVFWLLFAMAFAAPLWLPALVPSRLVTLSRIVRWICAVLVLVPLRYTVDVVLHQYRLFGGGNFSPTIFGVALLLTTGCALGTLLLLTPEFRRKVADAA